MTANEFCAFFLAGASTMALLVIMVNVIRIRIHVEHNL